MKRGIPRILASAALLAVGFASAWLLLPPRPGHAQSETTQKALSSALVRGEEAVPTQGPWGEWRRYYRGDAHGTKDMVVLVVTLKPGQAPHAPHRHAEEEFMILADGSGTWTTRRFLRVRVTCSTLRPGPCTA
jgi:mannose-6-phosphate isomerase-like protein (cupin superfamily)